MPVPALMACRFVPLQSGRVVFDLAKPAEHKIFTLGNPDRVVIDIKKADLTVDVGG